MTRVPLRVALVGLVLCAWDHSAAWAQADRVRDPAEMAPADASLYIGVTDFETVLKEIRATSAYRLFSSAEGAGGPTAGYLDEISKGLAAFAGVPREELKNPFKGPLAIYLAARPNAPGVELGLVAGVGDAAMMKAYYDGLSKVLTASAEDHRSHTEGPNTIEEYRFAVAGPPDNPGAAAVITFIESFTGRAELPRTVATCLSAERLIIGSSADDVRKLLASPKRESNLAGSEVHQALTRLRPLGNVRIVWNFATALEVQKHDRPEVVAAAEPMLKASGVDAVKALVGHVRLGAESYEWKLEALAVAPDDRRGLVKLLTPENRPTTPPPGTPADAFFYCSANVSPAALLEELQASKAPGFDPAMLAFLDQMPTASGQIVNLRTELLAHLKAPLAMWGMLAGPNQPEALRALATMGCASEESVGRVLEALCGPATEADGVKSHVLPFGVAFAAAKERVFAGTPNSVQEAAAGKSGTNLADAPRWKRAARSVPEQAWLVLYFDGRRFIDAALALGKAGSPPDFGMLGMFMNPALAQLVQHYESPAGQKSLAETAQTIVTVATTKSGIQLTIVAMNPEK